MDFKLVDYMRALRESHKRAHERIAELGEENARLRELVEAAYREGHQDGRASGYNPDGDWRQSEARAALRGTDRG